MFRGEPPRSVITEFLQFGRCEPRPPPSARKFHNARKLVPPPVVRVHFARGAKVAAVPTWSWPGLSPAIPIIGHCAILIEIAGTSPAMTPPYKAKHWPHKSFGGRKSS